MVLPNAVVTALRAEPVIESEVPSRLIGVTPGIPLPLDPEAVRPLLATVLPLSPPPDRLGEIPEVLEPLGLRARVPPTESVDGVVEPLRGSVLEKPGRLREDGSERWKLGVRRMLDVGVLWEPPPSQLSNDCIEPCFESVLRLAGRLPELLPAPALAEADAFRPPCKWKEPSPSLTELSGVPAENDARPIGELRAAVFSRILVMGPAVGREGDRA